jgi:hypothetical protein
MWSLQYFHIVDATYFKCGKEIAKLSYLTINNKGRAKSYTCPKQTQVCYSIGSPLKYF